MAAQGDHAARSCRFIMSTAKTRPTRRVVTGHDAGGKSVFVMDGPAPHVYCRTPGGGVVTELWETRGAPADNRGNDEVTDRPFRLHPPKTPAHLAFVLIDAESLP
jgi:hypothetical protein